MRRQQQPKQFGKWAQLSVAFREKPIEILGSSFRNLWKRDNARTGKWVINYKENENIFPFIIIESIMCYKGGGRSWQARYIVPQYIGKFLCECGGSDIASSSIFSPLICRHKYSFLSFRVFDRSSPSPCVFRCATTVMMWQLTGLSCLYWVGVFEEYL